jgi:hypothetical protein|eukprot:COSAG06_NODE_11706_length_1475_cov_1.174419_2_plen_49_part_00
MGLLNLVFLNDCILQCRKWLPYTPNRTANNDLERGLTEYQYSGVGGDE